MNDLKNKKTVFLGDSITEGVGASSAEKKYVNVFAKLSGAQTFNLGVSGTRLAKQIKPTLDSPSFDEHFVKRAKRIPKDADIIVVFGGVNDFLHGDAPFGNYGDKTCETFCGAVYDLFVNLYNDHPNALIIDITPLHHIYERSEIKKDGTKRDKSFYDYVEAIKKTCAFLSVPVLDLYATSNMQPMIETLNKTYFADGLHPNDFGHQNIAERLYAFLKTVN